MAVAPSFVASNETEILKAITTQMGIENLIGADEDARHSRPGRVVWVPEPSGRTYQSPPTDEALGGKVIHLLSVRHKVHIWGKDYNEACLLEAELLKALYTVLCPRNYDLGPTNPLVAQTPSTNGCKFELTVTLRRLPVFERMYTTQPLDTVTTQGQTTQPDNTSPTPFGAHTVSY